MTKIRALVVDDEPVARDRLVRLLEQQADVELVGQCSNGLETVTAIEQLSPDLVFLDVQMPEMDGFEVVRALEAGRVPAVVFVTAFDEYAVRAFEVHALDYLLKPFSSVRFRARSPTHGINSIAIAPGTSAAGSQLAPALWNRRLGEDRRPPAGAIDRPRTSSAPEIGWCEAAGSYVRLRQASRTSSAKR